MKWLTNNFSRKLSQLFYYQQWQLLYYKNSFLPTSFHRYKKLMPPIDRIWADPFVMKRGNYFVFFEEKLNKNNNAHISFFEFNPQGALVDKKPVIALLENHHLSYPFVFSYKGEDYMLPESASCKELNLYKCKLFPQKWEKHKTLISGKSISDATLYLHNEMWYLFCNEKTDDQLSSDAYLHIYFTDDFLNSPFLPHPMNPLYRDVTRSRPAGNLFMHKGMLFRPSQIAAPDYGSGIQLNHVTLLSPESFHENQIESLSPGWGKNIRGLHTINHADGFTVADIQARRFRWF